MENREIFQQRRNKLLMQLPEQSLVVVPANSEVLRNGDVHYHFRQDSNFYYLTGFQEPDALLILANITGVSKSIIFVRPKDDLLEQWNGKRLGVSDAPLQLGVEQAYGLENIDDQLAQYIARASNIYIALGKHFALEKKILKLLSALKSKRNHNTSNIAICDIAPVISEMRLFKDKLEIQNLKMAAEISVKAHLQAMRAVKDCRNEFELEAEILHVMGRNGCRSLAYGAIVAGGDNACTLHYTDNNQPLKSNALVLIDAGCEYKNYAADITRTFPVSGKFSPKQKALYSLVLKAQKAGINCIKPGNYWHEVQQTMVAILTTGLVELGILQGNVDDLIKQDACKAFYPHGSGHWLGLDVHDCGAYKIENKWRAFEPGMVLTVEPGIYIPDTFTQVDSGWRGIGIRIEDDILVTSLGHENLTKDLPVEIDDIEALIGE